MRVLLVALDLPTAGEISAAVESAWPGSTVLLAESPDEALSLLGGEPVDVVLLGEAHPQGPLALCERLCAEAPAPVILVAERDGIVDRRRAVELGVDDFLWRPFGERDVVSRIRHAVERARAEYPGEGLEPLEAGEWRIDYASRSVRVGSRAVELSATEYGVLYHLTRTPNSVVAYETLLAKVWGRTYVEDVEVLQVRVERLRAKLGDRGRTRPRIANRPGLGYLFQHEVEQRP